MKKLLCVLLLMLSSVCLAELSFQVGATTDYVSRGISYSNNGPAIQGSAEYSMPFGAMVGLWSSTLGDNGSGQELDFYAGYEKEIFTDFTAGAKIISYRYLKGTYNDYYEGNLSLSYKMFSFNIYHAPDVPVVDNTKTYKHWYFNLASSIEVMKDVALGCAVGYATFSDKTLADKKNYYDGTLSLTKTIQDKTISMNFSDTNRKNNAGEKQRDQSIYFMGTISL